MPDSPGWHARGYLPHFDDGRAMQAITYHLADSLPVHVCRRLEEQALDDAQRRAAVEHYLDAHHGTCLLRQPSCAAAVRDALHHRNDHDYRLYAWVIMPNHVHVIVEPLAEVTIGKTVSAWKSVSARRILEATDAEATGGGRGPGGPQIRRGRIWQLDYFDRYIRNQRHYRAAVDYIHRNPVTAGLVARAEDWPWSRAYQGPV